MDIASREVWLLWLLLAGYVWHFGWKFGETLGFDAGAHLEMLDHLTWSHPFIGLRALFYSYHPPLGFLLARAIHLLGPTSLRSVQILNFIASIAAFLLLRETLRRLKLLGRPGAVAFLYLFGAMPLTLYLQASINLDVLILATGSLVLLLSALLFWQEKPAMPRAGRIACGIGLVWALVTGMLFKFAGLLLFAIPPLVAFGLPSRPRWKQWLLAVQICVVALAVVFPYYYQRYYIHEHKFFPVNVEWFAGNLQKNRTIRDNNRLAYIERMLAPSPLHVTQGLVVRDYDVPRALDVWRDFWIKEKAFFGDMQPAVRRISLASFLLATVLCIHGLFVFLLYPDDDATWRRFGWIALGISAVFALSLFSAMYQFPDFGPAKGVYIPLALWGVAYLLSESLCRLPLAPFGRADKHSWNRLALSVFLAAFILLNVLLPVY